jgi:hypothetical protein
MSNLTHDQSFFYKFDYLVVILNFVLLLSIAIQLTYMISPQFVKRYLEWIDYNDEYVFCCRKTSISGVMSLIALIATLFFYKKVSDIMQLKYHIEEEKLVDRQYRHKEKWMTDSFCY